MSVYLRIPPQLLTLLLKEQELHLNYVNLNKACHPPVSFDGFIDCRSHEHKKYVTS